MRRSILIACALLAGCTIVNDPGRHQHGGQRDGGVDAGSPDAGTDGGPPDAGPPDAGPPRVEIAEFCAEHADVICTAYFGCCSTAMPLRTDPQFDEYFASCVTEAKRVCEDGSDLFSPILEELVDDELTGYDPVIGAEVLAEGRALGSACSLAFTSWGLERDGLARALRGTRAGGTVCTPGPLAGGTRPDYPALLSCEVREDGTYVACSLRSGVWSCVDRSREGEPCLSYFDCIDGHYCTSFFSGACAPRKENGEPCSSDVECLSRFCSGGTARVCAVPTVDDVYCPVAD